MKPLIDKELMNILACPVCKGDLKLIDFRGKPRKKDERGLDGKLFCKKCKLDYPIKEGIPILLPPELV
ncbi:MAG: Trm112 family protein [Candidatus Nanoarchaeia archaeon]|jgi:hypothetical protein